MIFLSKTIDMLPLKWYNYLEMSKQSAPLSPYASDVYSNKVDIALIK